MTASGYRYGENPRYPTPGVYFEESVPKKAPEFRTGVPAFVGFSHLDRNRDVQLCVLTGWAQFDEKLANVPTGGFLRHAVRGFFENGGEICVVVALHPHGLGDAPAEQSHPRVDRKIRQGFKALEELWDLKEVLKELSEAEEALAKELVEGVDLICVPDLPLVNESMIDLQREVLDYCEKKPDCFAILDSVPQRDVEGMVNHWRDLSSKNAALYFPWIRVPQGPVSTGGLVPPCGHVAGIYARVDSRIGVHKAPANEIVEGAIDLERHLTDQDQSKLNEVGVNCLRVFPGRGIRVWGVRTLSGLPEWRYVNIRRLFITLVRRIDQTCRDLVLEPHSPALWEMIRGRLNSYCYDLFQKGALKGQTPAEAFYVKCDAETNPREKLEAGEVIAEVGLAPVMPAEFIVVRITHSSAGTTFTGPGGPKEERR